MGFSKDNLIGFMLAISSSVFIGASFIIKKKGLRKAAAVSGVRAGVGGYSYLLEPLWWFGMITSKFFIFFFFFWYFFSFLLLIFLSQVISIFLNFT
ncbi:hypothetical protein CsSME_00042117 [Camellia sinensis var. sinensis]